MDSYYEKLMQQQIGLVIGEPMMVDQQDFGFADKAINHQRYLDYSKRKRTIIYSFSADIYLCRLSEHYIVFDDVNKEILYFVHFKNKMILGHKLTIQVLLWVDSSLAADKYKIDGDSVPTYVFFEKLLKEEGEGIGIATDVMQTPLGKRFWYDRVAKAFGRGMQVYFVDQNTQKIIQVKNHKEFKEKAKELETWSDGQASMARRVVISSKKLW